MGITAIPSAKDAERALQPVTPVFFRFRTLSILRVRVLYVSVCLRSYKRKQQIYSQLRLDRHIRIDAIRFDAVQVQELLFSAFLDSLRFLTKRLQE